jgi:hypothetical protein
LFADQVKGEGGKKEKEKTWGTKVFKCLSKKYCHREEKEVGKERQKGLLQFTQNLFLFLSSFLYLRVGVLDPKT